MGTCTSNSKSTKKHGRRQDRTSAETAAGAAAATGTQKSLKTTSETLTGSQRRHSVDTPGKIFQLIKALQSQKEMQYRTSAVAARNQTINMIIAGGDKYLAQAEAPCYSCPTLSEPKMSTIIRKRKDKQHLSQI